MFGSRCRADMHPHDKAPGGEGATLAALVDAWSAAPRDGTTRHRSNNTASICTTTPARPLVSGGGQPRVVISGLVYVALKGVAVVE